MAAGPEDGARLTRRDRKPRKYPEQSRKHYMITGHYIFLSSKKRYPQRQSSAGTLA